MPRLNRWWSWLTHPSVLLLLLGGMAGLALAAVAFTVTWSLAPALFAPAAPAGATSQEPDASAAAERHKVREVTLPRQMWSSAGLAIKPVQRGNLRNNKWVTGQLTANKDRTVQVYPLVAGRVQQVNVRFGEDVEAGEVLAVIDSRELAQAKLNLYEKRLEARIAAVKAEWAEKTNDNAQKMIDALWEGMPLDQLETKFKGDVLGTYRKELMVAYTDLFKSSRDYERVRNLGGSIAQRQVLAAKATFEADQAKLRAVLEQIQFTARQNALHARQNLERAQAQESIALAKLQILGFAPEQLQDIDPNAPSGAVAHYLARAPFASTVLEKEAALGERVGPKTQMFVLSDLDTVWVEAHIFQEDLPLLHNLSRGRIKFRSPYLEQIHEAEVFYRGYVVDPSTRTAPLLAEIRNPDRSLRPGMFIEVQLPGRVKENILHVPDTAIVKDKGQPFVFVHKGGETFVRRDVGLGLTSAEQVEILHGLKEGEPIVVEGTFALKSLLLEGAQGQQRDNAEVTEQDS